MVVTSYHNKIYLVRAPDNCLCIAVVPSLVIFITLPFFHVITYCLQKCECIYMDSLISDILLFFLLTRRNFSS